MRLTLAEIAAATGGVVVGDPALVVDGATTDSRALVPGALFVAVVAERDGHDFVAAARAAGAAAALVSRADALAPGGAGVVVADTLAALTDLGRAARARLGDRPVIGVTGSSGKTSTKDLLAGALATSRRVTASPASYNNELGVPTTLLAAGDDTDVVVCELGARGIGHITLLCEVVRPTVGVVTNVGTAHAAMYPDGARGIAWAKGELVAALPAAGTAVLNADDVATPGLATRTSARVLTFGMAGARPGDRPGDGGGPDVAVVDLALDDELRASFRLVTPWGVAAVRLEVRGAHQAANAAAAAAAALAVGAPLDAVAAGLGAARLSPWRMELTRTPDGITVVNDAYNANPESVAAALDALAALAVPPSGRRVAVLGPMAELGSVGAGAHRAIGERAARLDVDVLVVVGAGAAGIADGYGDAGRTIRVADAADAIAALAGELAPGDAVLVKASRVHGLEGVAHALATPARGAGAAGTPGAAGVVPTAEPAR